MYNLSPNLVDIISFGINFLETNIAQGIILGGKKSGVMQNFTLHVDPGYKFIEKFRLGIQYFMWKSEDFISKISSELKIENVNLLFFNGHSFTFRLSIKKD